MRKITLILLLISLSLSSQEIVIDSCGIDNKPILNDFEITYFKLEFKELKDLNLKEKKFAFAKGNYGSSIISKDDYFNFYGRKYFKENKKIANIIIKLNDKEKTISGGFDYIIVSWSKIVINEKKRKILILRLSNYLMKK